MYSHYPERTVAVLRNPGPERRIEACLRCVTRGWIPVNATHLKTIQEKLKAGTYEKHKEELSADLKHDFSLLSHCLKSLSNQRETQIAQPHENPFSLIAKLNAQQLSALLDIKADQVSPHRLAKASIPQVVPLKNSIVSVIAAEKLSKESNSRGTSIGLDEAYLGVSLRQFGLNLIAWNYPQVFSRALQAVKKGGEDLDTYLQRSLGLSPLILAEKISASWKLGADIRSCLKTGSPAEDISLASICSFAETYARSLDHEHFPAAEELWKKQAETLAELLPGVNLRKFSDEVRTEAEGRFKELADEMAESKDASAHFTEQPSSRRAQKLFNQNQFLKQCSEDLCGQFKSVYFRIEESGVSVGALGELIGIVIPAAGFIRGCVYLFNKEGNTLIPAVAIGKAMKGDFEPIKDSKNHAVVHAIYHEVPLMQAQLNSQGHQVTRVSAALLQGERPGVLCLEVDPKFAEEKNFDPLLHFKAIRRCLHDCLTP